MRESTFSFWEDDQFNVLLERNLTSEDIKPFLGSGYTAELWRLKGLNQQGSHFEAIVFQTSTKKAELVLTYASTSKSEEPVKVTLDSWRVQDGSDCSFDESTNGICFTIDKCHFAVATSEISLELLLKPVLSGWKPGSGEMRFGDLGEKRLHWSVPVPRALVTGRISIRNSHNSFEGIGYLDHWAANFKLSETLSSLWSAQMFADGYTLLLFSSQGNHLYSWKKKSAAMIACQNHILASTPNVELVKTFEREGSYSYPRSMVLRIEEAPGYSLVVDQFLSPALPFCFGESGSILASTSLLGCFKLRIYGQPITEVSGYGSINVINLKSK